ncbi:MAG: hypothetical protein QM756_40855 [Polyangiaceae bacterium]
MPHTVYKRRVHRAWLYVVSIAAAVTSFSGCSGAPIPAEKAARPAPAAPTPEVDACAAQPGKPEPAPLAKQYDGVLAAARCQAEIEVIMQRVSRALGVRCNYCHVQGDYGADTEHKRIANFMAREWVPRLKARDGRAVTCESCHLQGARGVAKLLGAPRSEPRALEWMTSFLSEEFITRDAQPLRCKTCHGANWGSPDFRRKLLLTDALTALP